MWMNCFHLPRSARTRWVTERIASAQAMARRLASEIKSRNERFEYCLAERISWAAESWPDEEKIGNGNFLPVDTRPNGRPLSGATFCSFCWLSNQVRLRKFV